MFTPLIHVRHAIAAHPLYFFLYLVWILYVFLWWRIFSPLRTTIHSTMNYPFLTSTSLELPQMLHLEWCSKEMKFNSLITLFYKQHLFQIFHLLDCFYHCLFYWKKYKLTWLCAKKIEYPLFALNVCNSPSLQLSGFQEGNNVFIACDDDDFTFFCSSIRIDICT